jgi:hypothetical protein
LVVAWQEREL